MTGSSREWHDSVLSWSSGPCFSGTSLTACCCCCCCASQVEKKTFAEEVNNAFKEAANGPMKGVLAVCEEPLVSVDFR
jgi:hypothetical protein